MVSIFGGKFPLLGPPDIDLGLKKGNGEFFTKKEIVYSPTTSIIEAAPYQTYAPQIQYAPMTSYAYQGASYIISSPGASVSKKQTQDLSSTPEMRGAWEVPTTVTQEPTAGITSGTNLTLLAGIVVCGLVAYGIITKKKKGGKY